LLAVVSEENNRPVPSLVERATLFALREADKFRASVVALCSLGNPNKVTGRRTVAALRGWLKETGRVVQKPCWGNPPRSPRVIYNAASAREMRGASSALGRWTSDVMRELWDREPFAFLDKSMRFAQEGEGEDDKDKDDEDDDLSHLPPSSSISGPKNSFFEVVTCFLNF
jgi:hypothetical protein